MHVDLQWITPDAERQMIYCARVSSPHQDNPEYAGLLRYCMQHNHWSVFEQAYACVEIETSRAIARQILRHRSFSFQEWSQRYSDSPRLKPWNRACKLPKIASPEPIILTLHQDVACVGGKATQNQIAAFYKSCLRSGIAREKVLVLSS